MKCDLVKVNMFPSSHITLTLCPFFITLKVLVTTIDALGHFKQDNHSTVGGDGGCRVGEVRAGTTSPMPDHKGFLSYSNCQRSTHEVNFQKFSTLRVKTD